MRYPREAFPEIQAPPFHAVWLAADALCDVIYLADVAVQLRTSFLESGLVVSDARRLAAHYVRTPDFVVDLLALVPLDLIQLGVGTHPLVR